MLGITDRLFVLFPFLFVRNLRGVFFLRPSPRPAALVARWIRFSYIPVWIPVTDNFPVAGRNSHFESSGWKESAELAQLPAFRLATYA